MVRKVRGEKGSVTVYNQALCSIEDMVIMMGGTYMGVLPHIQCATVTNFCKIRYNEKYTSIFDFFFVHT